MPRRARSPADTASSNDETSAAPTNSASSTLPNIKDWKLLGDNKTCMWLNAETARISAAGGSLNLKTVKIASFDMDDTLIMPASGAVFAKSAADWKWLCPQVLPKLKDLAQNENYFVVIFSNQGGVGKAGVGKEDLSKRRDIESKIVELNKQSGGIPISAMCATHDDGFRKPSPKMWSTLQDRFRVEGILAPTGTLDLANSFYCGDAAGREIMTMADRKKDFSCGDRKFAYNLGLKFCTPEELFLGKAPAPFKWGAITPEVIADLKKKSTTQTYPSNLVGDLSKPELVLMVGYPGAGKSTVATKKFVAAGYVWVNRDTLKTPKKCQDAATAALQAGKSVVIDNTNPKASDRKEYINIAKKFKAPVRCVVMDSSYDVAKHLAWFRESVTGIHIPGMVFNIFRKYYEEPSTSEGISEIIKCPLILDTSKMSEEQKATLFGLSM